MIHECAFIEAFKIVRTNTVQGCMLSPFLYFLHYYTSAPSQFMSILWAESFKFSASLKAHDMNRVVSVGVESLTWNYTQLWTSSKISVKSKRDVLQTHSGKSVCSRIRASPEICHWCSVDYTYDSSTLEVTNVPLFVCYEVCKLIYLSIFTT